MAKIGLNMGVLLLLVGALLILQADARPGGRGKRSNDATGEDNSSSKGDLTASELKGFMKEKGDRDLRFRRSFGDSSAVW